MTKEQIEALGEKIRQLEALRAAGLNDEQIIADKIRAYKADNPTGCIPYVDLPQRDKEGRKLYQFLSENDAHNQYGRGVPTKSLEHPWRGVVFAHGGEIHRAVARTV